MDKKIGILGFGNMGRACYLGISSALPNTSFYVFDTDPKKVEKLSSDERAKTPSEVVKTSDYVILATKPQSFLDLAKELTLYSDVPVFISIMAGVSLKNLKKALGTKNVVRSMPNLPITLQEGVIGWVTSKEITDNQIREIKKIFSSLGTEIKLASEKDIDTITALSGSGPAYFFYLAEVLERQAEKWGFKKDTAQKIAIQTIYGSALLLKESKASPEKWRKRVTSKKGTTEAALSCLKKNNWDTIFAKALVHARKRSKELNNEQ